jgi:hypothetical protein
LAEFLVAEGVVDISHKGLRVLLGEEGVSIQVIKTWRLQGVSATLNTKRCVSWSSASLPDAARVVCCGHLFACADPTPRWLPY